MRAYTIRLLPVLLLAACPSGDDGDDTDDTDDTDTDVAEEFDFDARGDFSCFTPAASAADVVWAPAQDVIADAGMVDLNGSVEDFQNPEDVDASQRNLTMWFDDVASGDGDVENEDFDDDAEITVSDVPACQPLAWLVEETPGLNVAKPTYKAHQIYGQGSGGELDVEFQTVSIDTYLLIPTIVGVDVDPTKGSIAGTMYDCTRDPDTLPSVDPGKVEGVKVRVTDLDGNPAPDGIEIAYFIQKTPSRDQPWTSADGLWGAFNVPPGDWRVEAYGQVEGEVVVLGATEVTVYADSINIANIWGGYESGVKYPEACLTE